VLAIESSTKSRVRKTLLGCGILSSVLYFASDAVMSLSYEGYSYLHQTVSELNAIGAPTRGLSIVFGLAGYVLLICFGVGIWMSAAGNRKLRVVGVALAVMGLTGLWGVPFASMQARGTEQEALHLISGMVGVLLLVTAIGFAAAAFGGPFRLYSIATIVVMIVFAGWTGRQAYAIEAGMPTPWVGFIERISFYSWHLWFIVLALILLRRHSLDEIRRILI
jgi:Protein of unknown function (DUF998)